MDVSVLSLARLALRWWWLFIVGVLVGGGVGYSVSAQTEPMYSSSVLLQVNSPRAGDSFDPDFIDASQVIALTYRQIVWNQEILEPVRQDLQLPYGLEELREHVSAWTISGTRTLEISVDDSDPDRAADIANAIAASLIRHAEAETEASRAPARIAIEEQINATSLRVEQLNAEIIALEQDLDEEDAAAVERLDQLRTTRDELNSTYFDHLSTQQQMNIDASGAVSPLSVATHAEPESAPEESPSMATAFGSAFGLVVAGSVVLGLGYLDRTIRPSTDVESLVGVPVLGRVADAPRMRSVIDALFVQQTPHSRASESMRSVRMALSLKLLPENKRILAVSSPEFNDGTSVFSANLAVAAAQSGLKTVLIDGHLHPPRQHRLFGIPNDRGLSTWLKYHDRVPRTSDYWNDLARKTILPALQVIPAGPAIDSPSDVQLSNGRLADLLVAIQKDVDLVIVDTPSIAETNDGVLIAVDVDAVVLVCQPARSDQRSLVRAVERLGPTGTPVIGVVLSSVTGPGKSRKWVSKTATKASKEREWALDAPGNTMVAVHEFSNSAD